MIRYFCVLLLVVFAQADHTSDEWRSLFHIRSDEATGILDDRFYLSKEKTLKSEYFAAIKALEDSDYKETLCRFPARYRYLSKALDLNLSFEHCENLNLFLSESRGDFATISFVYAHLESPMSYFGHTFITVKKSNDRFFSKTFSFLAELPADVGFFELINKGIKGGFPGRFIVSEYFKMFEKYSVVEQRAINEYRLKLNKEEIEDMLWHMYELLGVEVEYKFFTNNCAYETIWLLAVAKKNPAMIEDLRIIVAPYETVKLLKEEDMIASVTTQPSSVEVMLAVYDGLDSDEQRFFRQFINEYNKTKRLGSSDLNEESKDKIGYLVNGYYDLLFKKFHYGKSDFDEVKAIPYNPRVEQKDGEKEVRGGSKIELGYGSYKQGSRSFVKLKAYSFNRHEDYFSTMGDATLEIMAFDIERQEKKEYINSIDLFSIESYKKWFSFYRVPSWSLYIGADRAMKEELSPTVKIGVGGGFGTINTIYYVVPQLALYCDMVGLDLKSGFGVWYQNMHFGADYFRSIAYTKKGVRQDIAELYWIYVRSNTSFKLSGTKDYLKASISYQF